MTEKDLFITIPDGFYHQAKSYNNSPAKTTQHVAIHKRRPGISIPRFAAYTFILILLLPFFLINGRDSVKLNKVKYDNDPDQGLQ